MKFTTTYIILLTTLLSLVSCQYTKQRKQAEQQTNMLLTQLTEEQKTPKSQEAQNMTDSLNELRGYPLESTESNSISIDYNTGIVIVTLIGILFFGFMGYRIVKGFKVGIKNYTYAVGEMKEKANEILNTPEQAEKLSEEERKNIEQALKMFSKK